MVFKLGGRGPGRATLELSSFSEVRSFVYSD